MVSIDFFVFNIIFVFFFSVHFHFFAASLLSISTLCWYRNTNDIVATTGATIYAESERVRSTIAFESIRYGEIFTNETLDIYGIDLPEGIFKQHFFLTKIVAPLLLSAIEYSICHGWIYAIIPFPFPFIIYIRDFVIGLTFNYLVMQDAPIHVFIHGGYWQELDKTISAYIVRPLVENGIKVIVLDYDLCPRITLAQLVDQIQRAGEFIINYATKLGSK